MRLSVKGVRFMVSVDRCVLLLLVDGSGGCRGGEQWNDGLMRYGMEIIECFVSCTTAGVCGHGGVYYGTCV